MASLRVLASRLRGHQLAHKAATTTSCSSYAARWMQTPQVQQHRSMSSSSKQAELPSHASAVIVGGGVIGTSVAYHLAKLGWKDVLLLERDQLTSGTTWHAAGLINTFGSMSESMIDMRLYTRELYSKLEEETGHSTGFMPCGFIELATNEDRLHEYRRVAAFNRTLGVDVHEIGPDEVKEHFPLCKTDDVLAGFYSVGDGRANPVDVTMSLAAGARMHGAKLVQGVSVTGVTKTGNRVTGVNTADGQTVKADVVVNCAGMWARQLGELDGVTIPNQAAEHYYLITDAIPEVDPSWPIIEDPTSYVYIRPEGAGLMVGLFETDAAAWSVDRVPESFSFGEIQPDWERMGPFLEKAMERVPATQTVGAKNFFCGPESFTPDLSPIVGEAPELRGYFVAAGLNSNGILAGGGIGRVLAQWIDTGVPDVDVTGINIDRLHKYQANPAYRAERVEESLGLVYRCHYPTRSHQTARGVKRSAVYDRLAQRGAYFSDVSGWEGAAWYAVPDGADAGLQTVPEQGKLSWGRHVWFPNWAAEHHACREGAIIMDMSFMSKFLVQGPGAGDMLNWLSTANVDAETDVITYTQWLNSHGKMEADLTVTKLGPQSSPNNPYGADQFIVVATDTMHRHVETWMRKATESRPEWGGITIGDVTGAYTQLNLQGPRSRELLAMLTTEDMSNEAFPFRTAREIDIGFARALCTRITYVGELGYELFVPSEMALHAYDRIVEAGESVGLMHAGLRALGSLRMEKGYRDYGHDMDNTDTLLEVGLGFTADFDKPGGFLGAEHVLAQKERGIPSKRLVQVLLEDAEPLMHHGEVVLRNGQPVGDVRAASYGHTLGGAVGLSMVSTGDDGVRLTAKWIREGTWTVDVAGVQYPAKVSLRPMYDPKNEKIKA